MPDAVSPTSMTISAAAPRTSAPWSSTAPFRSTVRGSEGIRIRTRCSRGVRTPARLWPPAVVGPALEKVRADPAGQEVVVLEDALMQRDGGFHSLDNSHFQGSLHAPYGFQPVPSVGDDFCYERVVVGCNHIVSIRGGINMHP